MVTSARCERAVEECPMKRLLLAGDYSLRIRWKLLNSYSSVRSHAHPRASRMINQKFRLDRSITQSFARAMWRVQGEFTRKALLIAIDDRAFSL